MTNGSGGGLLDIILLIPRLILLGLVKVLTAPAKVLDTIARDLNVLPKFIGGVFKAVFNKFSP